MKTMLLLAIFAACGQIEQEQVRPYGSGETVAVGDCAHSHLKQCEAEQIVWRDWLKMQQPAPSVEWISTPCPLVDYPYGQGHPAIVENGRCLAGEIIGNPPFIRVAEEQLIGNSSYAHEMVHAHLFLTTGDPDGGHASPLFWDGVATINQRLRDLGI